MELKSKREAAELLGVSTRGSRLLMGSLGRLK
jgi:hypothetical protein